MVKVDTKLRVFLYKILNNIFFMNKMLFKPSQVQLLLCSFCKAEDETYIHLLYGAEKLPFCGDNLRIFLVTLSIFTQSAIFGFLDDDFEHKLLLNHILLIFKNYLYKAKENKDLNFNVLKNYPTRIGDLEANLKDNDKYNKN